jgi:enoyl-CoA hydratase
VKRSERENQFVDAMAEEAENQIQLEVGSSGIAIITFNRPKALNALTRDMLTRLAELFQELDQRPAVKVIILTGAGRAFSAGVVLSQHSCFQFH